MKPLIIAHRGGPGEKVLENSMEAYRYSLTTGCNSIETDLRQGKEKKIYTLHDRTLTRTTGINRALRNFTPRQLNRVKLINGEKIPSLEDLLQLVRSYNKTAQKKMQLHLEIKEGGFEKELVEQLAAFKMTDFVIVISFYATVLKKIHNLNPSLKTGYLLYKEKNWHNYPSFCQVVLPWFELLTSEKIKELHDAGKEIHVWTVDNPQDAYRLWNKVDGIITNYPQTLVHFLNSLSRVGIAISASPKTSSKSSLLVRSQTRKQACSLTRSLRSKNVHKKVTKWQ